MSKISRVTILGERCSGTNYLELLLNQNFNIKTEVDEKHWHINPNNINYSDSNLYIIMARNVYDFLRSLYIQRHHVPSRIFRKNFSQFIRTEWYSIRSGVDFRNDWNPRTKEHYSNILKMRSGKYKHWFDLQGVVPNFYYINYEELRSDHEFILTSISEKFNIPLIGREIVNVNTYKKTSETYKKKTYPPIKAGDLNYINEQLDWNMEQKLGYSVEPC